MDGEAALVPLFFLPTDPKILTPTFSAAILPKGLAELRRSKKSELNARYSLSRSRALKKRKEKTVTIALDILHPPCFFYFFPPF